jgi:hypothetical protein
MELLRLCPCPVWLAGAQKQRESTPHILAAIHANPANPDEQHLNASILDLALTMRDLMGGRLHVIQAWIAFGETLLASHMPPHEVDQYVEAARASEQQALEDVTRAFGDRLGDTAAELVKGETEDVISALCRGKGYRSGRHGHRCQNGHYGPFDRQYRRAGAPAPPRVGARDQACRIYIARRRVARGSARGHGDVLVNGVARVHDHLVAFGQPREQFGLYGVALADLNSRLRRPRISHGEGRPGISDTE